MSDETCVRILREPDIVTARHEGRIVAEQAGFGRTDLTLIATVISELARNIVEYSHGGELCVSLEPGEPASFVIIARDSGPGISDVARAMTDGYSTGGGLGLGLPGVRRLMDEFEITSTAGEGTVVQAKKWLTH